MLEQRTWIKYGTGNHFDVVDANGKVLQRYETKTEAIAKSQELNGYDPIDGNETTYARQTGLCTVKKNTQV